MIRGLIAGVAITWLVAAGGNLSLLMEVPAEKASWGIFWMRLFMGAFGVGILAAWPREVTS